jgi:hypothetical protein
MVQAPVASPGIAGESSARISLSNSAATNASIARYLAAGEQMRVIAGWAALACLALMAVFVVAMAVGILPVTVRPL